MTRNSEFPVCSIFASLFRADLCLNPNKTDRVFIILRKKIMILICMIVAGTIGTYIALSYLGILG